MVEQKPKIGKKGAAAGVTKKITAIRKAPLSKNIFEIVEKAFEKNQKPNPQRKSAKSKDDLEM